MSEELKELRDIKKLLVLLLTKNKASNVEIAKTLGVNESVVRYWLNQKREKGAKEKAKDN